MNKTLRLLFFCRDGDIDGCSRVTGAKAEASVLLKGEYFPILDSTVISVQFPAIEITVKSISKLNMFNL